MPRCRSADQWRLPPTDGLITVTYSSGPSGNANQDAYNAAKIIWTTLGYRFGGLVITTTSGGCTGPVCVSHSQEIAEAGYQ